MKHLKAIMAAMVLVASGCESEKIESVTQQEVTGQMKAPVTVSVSGFSFDLVDFSLTRGTAMADYNGVKAVTLAFYDDELTLTSLTLAEYTGGSFSVGTDWLPAHEMTF